MYRLTKVSFVVLTAATLATAAYAANAVHNDAQAALNAKISLVQAIGTAEQAAKGKAVRAEFKHTQSGWAYKVEVISGSKTFDVFIDGNKGTLLSSKEDKEDHGDDHD